MIEIKINEKLVESLGQIPLLLRAGPMDRCFKQFAKPIQARAATLAPSSSESGSRKRWSKKFRDNPAFASIDSRNHFGSKVMKNGVGVIIGATYPKGNKQQFVNPNKRGDTYQRNLWGKPGQQVQKVSKTGKTFTATVGTRPQTARFPKSERAIVRAFDQTVSAAESSFLAQLTKELKELRLG